MLTGDMLRRSAARFPDKPAIIWRSPEQPRRVVSYRALDEQANQFAHALLGLGLAKGAKVSVMSRNLPEYGTAFFGIARTGYVMNNVSILYAEDELAWVLNRSDSEALLIDAAYADRLPRVRAQCPRIRTAIVIGSHEGAAAVTFDAFIAGKPTTPPSVNPDEHDPFCMTYTGGTTGRPKGVLASHRARAVTALTVVVEERLTPEDVVAIVTPLFHVAALNIMFQPAVLIGATSVFITPWSPASFMNAVREEGVSAAFMVPTQANTLVTHVDFDPAHLRSWTKLSFAGAPMPDWVQLELMEKLPQLRLTQIYGQSEMGVIAALPHHLLPAKLGSVGRQPFNVDLAVLRPDGTPVAVGEVGEVATRGDNVMIEYYNEPEQTRAFFQRGTEWGLSGDMATIDSDGCITLIDRAKDMLISGGENVYPKEIEDAIYGLQPVAEVAVFGIPDDKFGEVPAAYIQLKPGTKLTEAEVLAQCEARLARLKRPRLIRFVDGFPKTAIGKIQKTLLKEPYWQGRKKI